MDGVGPTSHVSSSAHELKRETNPLLELGNTAGDMNMASPYRDMRHEAQDLGRVDEVLPMDVEGETVKTLDETERETIENALRRNNGRRKLTAQELNISERTLYRKIKQYNLERQ
jgi:DNA-binding NtrC family response regulator